MKHCEKKGETCIVQELYGSPATLKPKRTSVLAQPLHTHKNNRLDGWKQCGEKAAFFKPLKPYCILDHTAYRVTKIADLQSHNTVYDELVDKLCLKNYGYNDIPLIGMPG